MKINLKYLLSLTVCCLLLANARLNGQVNLVPNPSFEDTVDCPAGLAEIFKTAYWNAPTQGSPDFFHSCANNTSGASVPYNIFGNQPPQHGSAYVGLAVYISQSTQSYREYIQAPLTQTLTPGQKYFVCFYASLADTCKYGIRELGAFFSNSQLNLSMDSALLINPQIVFTDHVITDKDQWTMIQGSFVANGNESYILLGNFNRNHTTTTTQVNNNNNDPYAYYYIDNICVSTDSNICAQTTGLNNYNNKFSISLFPNPFSESFFIRMDQNEPYDLVIYDIMGDVVLDKKNIVGGLQEINTTSIDRNILYANIRFQNQSFYYKLIKQ